MTTKVLMVDDSRTALAALRLALESDPRLLVVGEASTGKQALDLCERLDPDLVTMDVHLTEESGFDITREIMTRFPRPILIVTGADIAHPDLIYQSMANGALDVFAKLPSPQSPEYAEERRRLTRVVRTLATVPVLHRARGRSPGGSALQTAGPTFPRAEAGAAARTPGIVAIGASTGGPLVIAAILEKVPAQTRAPIVVAQHISRGFAASFALWLDGVCPHKVVLASEGQSLQPGVVYVAPDCADLAFVARNEIVVEGSRDPSALHPSIDRLFESLARHAGEDACAIVLSGMGRDGASGLEALAARGAQTIVQAPDSCAVDSMPRNAMARGAVRLVLRPDEISALLRARLS